MSADSKIKTLLIVDDSRVSRMIIRAMVQGRRPDWLVLEASNGEEAIQTVERDTPNYITMDLNMPGIDGLQTSERILQQVPATRIAVFTANVQDSTRKKSAELGLIFIPKPITQEGVDQALAFFAGNG